MVGYWQKSHTSADAMVPLSTHIKANWAGSKLRTPTDPCLHMKNNMIFLWMLSISIPKICKFKNRILRPIFMEFNLTIIVPKSIKYIHILIRTFAYLYKVSLIYYFKYKTLFFLAFFLVAVHPMMLLPILLTKNGYKLFPVQLFYCWPKLSTHVASCCRAPYSGYSVLGTWLWFNFHMKTSICVCAPASS